MVEGRGRMWLKIMGEIWEKNGTRYPLFTVPLSPFFQGSKIFATVPFVEISSLHSAHRENGILSHSRTLTTTAASADA